MKKRICILTIIIIFVCILSLFISCFIDETKIFETDENISMVIKEGTLTDKGATLIISDLCNNTTFGEWYNIYEFINGKWKKLNYIIKEPVAWQTMGYLTNSNCKLEMDVDWEPLYGTLTPGKYRIVKKANKKYMFVEFNLE